MFCEKTMEEMYDCYKLCDDFMTDFACKHHYFTLVDSKLKSLNEEHLNHIDQITEIMYIMYLWVNDAVKHKYKHITERLLDVIIKKCDEFEFCHNMRPFEYWGHIDLFTIMTKLRNIIVKYRIILKTPHLSQDG